MEMVIEKHDKNTQDSFNMATVNAEMLALYIFCLICVLSRIANNLKVTFPVVLFNPIIPGITFRYFKACV